MNLQVLRQVRTEQPEDTQALAGWVASRLQPGQVVALVGELGAGKTTFVRGLAEALGYLGRVRSPSFTLVHRYPTDPPLTHADLYRLYSEDELVALDLEGDLERGILVVEWADRLKGFWGEADWRIEFSIPDGSEEENVREIKVYTAQGVDA